MRALRARPIRDVDGVDAAFFEQTFAAARAPR